MQFFLSLSVIVLARAAAGNAKKNEKGANIIFLMMDDFGRSDTSSMGAQWDTPHMDSFQAESIYLSHHYIGYVCSTSRSQFLTGRYSYTLGYGELDVFTNGKIGGIPLSTPTLAQYLKQYSNPETNKYNTYLVGKWQLGYAIDEQLPTSKGFDYFWGFYGGEETYYEKTAPVFASGSAPSGSDFPDYIATDSSYYLDFWENNEVERDASDQISISQYFEKSMELIDRHDDVNSDVYGNNFFLYMGAQVTHGPVPTELYGEDQVFLDACKKKYGINSSFRMSILCTLSISFDYHFGKFITYLKEEKPDIYDNTVIVLTSDNGGDLGQQCNYPLRGGKNTYFEGSQRVLTILGGGLIPDKRRGSVLSGLMSNVDWTPTLLSYANILPHEYKKVQFVDNGDDAISFSLDGYNMYSYLMGLDDTPVRDHIVMTLTPKINQRTKERQANYDDLIAKFNKDKDSVSIRDLQLDEIAIVFFDQDGNFWKYVSGDESTNELGDVSENSQWCEVNAQYFTGKSELQFALVDSISDDYTYDANDCVEAIYDLTNDVREVNNLYSNQKTAKQIEEIVVEKALYYFDDEYTQSSDYTNGKYLCLYGNHMDKAWPGYWNGTWSPFMTKEAWQDLLVEECQITRDSVLYKQQTELFDFKSLANGDKNFINVIKDDTHSLAVTNERAKNADINEFNYYRQLRKMTETKNANDNIYPKKAQVASARVESSGTLSVFDGTASIAYLSIFVAALLVIGLAVGCICCTGRKGYQRPEYHVVERVGYGTL